MPFGWRIVSGSIGQWLPSIDFVLAKKKRKKCNCFLPNVSRDPHPTCTICCKNECFRTILVCALWDEGQWTEFDMWDHDIAVKKENKRKLS